MSGKHYTVALNFGVTARYDGNHYMDIKVIKEWVCFVYNHLRSNNIYNLIHFWMFLSACDHFTAMRTNFVDYVGTTTETLKMTSRPQPVNWSKAPMTSVTAGTQTLSKAHGTLREAHAVTTKRHVSINSHHRWLTSDSAFRCNKPEVGPSPGCTDAEQELYEGPAYCGIILDSNGPFAACHPKVNPNVSEIEQVN